MIPRTIFDFSPYDYPNYNAKCCMMDCTAINIRPHPGRMNAISNCSYVYYMNIKNYDLCSRHSYYKIIKYVLIIQNSWRKYYDKKNLNTLVLNQILVERMSYLCSNDYIYNNNNQNFIPKKIYISDQMFSYVCKIPGCRVKHRNIYFSTWSKDKLRAEKLSNYLPSVSFENRIYYDNLNEDENKIHDSYKEYSNKFKHRLNVCDYHLYIEKTAIVIQNHWRKYRLSKCKKKLRFFYFNRVAEFNIDILEKIESFYDITVS